jgi:hypothetical protein
LSVELSKGDRQNHLTKKKNDEKISFNAFKSQVREGRDNPMKNLTYNGILI